MWKFVPKRLPGNLVTAPLLAQSVTATSNNLVVKGRRAHDDGRNMGTILPT